MIFIGIILEAPIYWHSYHSEKVKQNFSSEATVAKQLFPQVLQNWSSILPVPPTESRINGTSYLVCPKRGKWRVDSLFTFRTDTGG